MRFKSVHNTWLSSKRQGEAWRHNYFLRYNKWIFISTLVNEPHWGINVAYLPLKKGINRLVALNGHHHVDGEPPLLHCFVRWVSELAEASKKLSSQPRRHWDCSERHHTDTCPSLVERCNLLPTISVRPPLLDIHRQWQQWHFLPLDFTTYVAIGITEGKDSRL